MDDASTVEETAAENRYPPYLRLVWSRPADAPPPPPRRPTNLALAIERHIAGEDGLSDQEFVRIYAGSRRDAPPPLRTVSG
jgi:hypothetical protein